MRQQVSSKENSFLRRLKKQGVEDRFLLKNTPHSVASTGRTLKTAAGESYWL